MSLLRGLIRSFQRVLAARSGSRYWWHQQLGHQYLPSVYGILSSRERALILDWYDDTDRQFPSGAGESCVPMLSLLQGLVMGNGIDTIVQCGHYHGYSTILLSMFLRHMGRERGLYSVDISPEVTSYTQRWLERGRLTAVAHLETASSTNKDLPRKAREYFGKQGIKLVYIDSSHAYTHTAEELEMWFNELAPGGFMVVHDASSFARQFCSEQKGGVHQALDDWNLGNRGSLLWINKTVTAPFNSHEYPAYCDPCGVAVIHKNASPITTQH